MAFNLNYSRKPERALDGHLIDEMISIYGVSCLWLYSERINEDNTCFKDFSHFKVDKDYKQVTLLPENQENFDGEVSFGGFGMFQAYSTELFISAASLLSLYPEFLTKRGARSNVLNSLLLTPGGQILEVTNVESFDLGISNQFTYADNPNSYKLSCKLYTPNQSDESVSSIKSSIKLEEDEIFEYDEAVDTSQIDDFFKELDIVKDTQNLEGDKKSDSGGVFGSLG